jgi:hypothetical protein
MDSGFSFLFFLSFFFPIFSFCSKSGDHPKELAKSGYKTDREEKKSRNPITCCPTIRMHQLNMVISKEVN